MVWFTLKSTQAVASGLPTLHHGASFYHTTLIDKFILKIFMLIVLSSRNMGLHTRIQELFTSTKINTEEFAKFTCLLQSLLIRTLYNFLQGFVDRKTLFKFSCQKIYRQKNRQIEDRRWDPMSYIYLYVLTNCYLVCICLFYLVNTFTI